MQYLISKLDVPPVKNGVREWLLPVKIFFAYVEYYTGGMQISGSLWQLFS